jgi:hypothetical protein
VLRLKLTVVLGAIVVGACGDTPYRMRATGGNSAGGSATGGVPLTGGGGSAAATGGSGGLGSVATGGRGGGGGNGGAGGADASVFPDAAMTCRPAPLCPSGWYEYTDRACSHPWGTTLPACRSNGDGLCYQTCVTNADCGDPLFPSCGSITIFRGGDVGEQKSVCQSVTLVLACPASADGGLGGGGGGAGGNNGGAGGGPMGGTRYGGAGGGGGIEGRGGAGGAGGGGDGGAMGGRGGGGGSLPGSGGQTGSIDGGGDLCAAARPLKCGDFVSDSTALSGRPSVWFGYGGTARGETGREVVYAFQSTNDCAVTVELGPTTVDLDLFALSACNPLSGNFAASSTPLDIQTVEAVSWINRPGTVYIVVDGYNGAEGAYSLDVRCTCQ